MADIADHADPAQSQQIAPGRPGNLDEAQKQALVELKKALVPEVYAESQLPEDAYLCRFLRAREFHVGKTKTMMAKAKSWRDEMQVEKLWNEWVHRDSALSDEKRLKVLSRQDMSREEQAKIVDAWNQYFHATDKGGRPLYIQHSGIDPKKLFAAASERRLLENFIMNFEGVIKTRYPACSEASGKTIDNSFLLMDMDGLSLTAFWKIRVIFQDIIQMSQDFFPETSGLIRVINNGPVFDICYAALKPFLAKRTVDKIKFYGYNYHEALLQEVDADALPKRYGGTCECEGGCVLSNRGPWPKHIPPNKAYATQSNGPSAEKVGQASQPVEKGQQPDVVEATA